MKDLTKLFCDLISFGAQLAKHDAPMEQVMSCLAGIVLNEEIAYVGTLDYDAIHNHINNVRVALRGSDHDIDTIRERLVKGLPVSVSRISEFHNRYVLKLSTGDELRFDASEIVHY